MAWLVAGGLTGVFVAVLQVILLQPLIVEAERYEAGEARVHEAGQQPAAVAHEEGGPYVPGSARIDLERSLLTIGFHVILWAGFGLVFGALSDLIALFSGGSSSRRCALCAAGFAAFVVAPTVGLPPELPGMAAADLGARQLWWIVSAAATLGAAMMVLIGRSPWVWAASAILLVLPHAIGAPHLSEVRADVVPPDLAAAFAARTIAVGFAGWVALAGAMHLTEVREAMA